MKTIKTPFYLAFFMIMSQGVISQNWNLVWQDEFENGISSDWVFETGNGYSGWGNNELQYYRRENATVENGALVITAKKETFNGYKYTSARMKTQGTQKFKYGKIEARIALPSSQGIWPAFWMLGSDISSVGWPACGEIDIMEHVNNESDSYGTIHWQDDNGNYASYGGHTAVNVNNYHVYTIEWDENSITWFIDGNQFHNVDISNGINGTSEFHNAYFLLLNVAVGGNWPGFTIDDSALPARMYVDYVRVYQDAVVNPEPSQVIEAENYTSMLGVEKENCSEGGENVGYIDSGDWMAFNNVTFPISGDYLIEYRVASVVGTGILSADINAGSTVLGQVSIPNTGGWQNWTTISHTVYVNAGTYPFGIYAVTGDWNINWIRVSKIGAIVETLDINEVSKITENVIYPNPVVGSILYFSSDMTGANVSIVNSQGALSRCSVNNNSIDLSAIKPGLYSIIIDKENRRTIKRFIKK